MQDVEKVINEYDGHDLRGRPVEMVFTHPTSSLHEVDRSLWYRDAGTKAQVRSRISLPLQSIRFYLPPAHVVPAYFHDTVAKAATICIHGGRPNAIPYLLPRAKHLHVNVAEQYRSNRPLRLSASSVLTRIEGCADLETLEISCLGETTGMVRHEQKRRIIHPRLRTIRFHANLRTTLASFTGKVDFPALSTIVIQSVQDISSKTISAWQDFTDSITSSTIKRLEFLDADLNEGDSRDYEHRSLAFVWTIASMKGLEELVLGGNAATAFVSVLNTISNDKNGFLPRWTHLTLLNSLVHGGDVHKLVAVRIRKSISIESIPNTQCLPLRQLNVVECPRISTKRLGWMQEDLRRGTLF